MLFNTFALLQLISCSYELSYKQNLKFVFYIKDTLLKRFFMKGFSRQSLLDFYLIFIQKAMQKWKPPSNFIYRACFVFKIFKFLFFALY